MIPRNISTEEPICREGTGYPFLAIDWPKLSFGFLLGVMKKIDFLVSPILILHYCFKNTYVYDFLKSYTYDNFALKRTKVLPKYHFKFFLYFFLIYGRRIDKLKA